MKKIFICFLTFLMLTGLVGCNTNSSETNELNESGFPQIDESIEYASIVEVTINPAFRFYLDNEQYVIKTESLNDDAKSVCENLELSEKSFDEALSEVLVESVVQGYLTDEKTVNVQVVKNSLDVYAPNIVQNTAGIIADITTTYDLKSDYSVSISDEVITEQSGSWTTEDVSIYVDENINFNNESEQKTLDTNSKNICAKCNGIGSVKCDRCNGSGKVIEYEEHEIDVRNDYVCPYCGGAGVLDDGLHGGKTAVCGFCGGEGKTGPESGDFRELAYDKEIVTEEVEKVCGSCNGSGTITCNSCNGTGLAS